MTVLAGFALGLAGSLHCVAMCGPLVGLLAPAFGRRFASALGYQLGRVGTYVAVGAVAGLAGAAAGMAGVGRGLSIVAGTVMLLTAVGVAMRTRTPVGTWWTRRLTTALAALGRVRATHPAASTVGAGMVNGALPCGLVYAAALAAATAGGPLDGAVVMLAFGAGTMPAILGVWMSASRLPAGLRQRLRLLTPAALGIVGVLLVIRGITAATAGPHHLH